MGYLKYFPQIVDSVLVGIKRLDVSSTAPFTWSADFVLFALTSSQSIDLEQGLPSSNASLPSREELGKFIFSHQNHGRDLLLCVDDIAIDHWGITEQASAFHE